MVGEILDGGVVDAGLDGGVVGEILDGGPVVGAGLDAGVVGGPADSTVGADIWARAEGEAAPSDIATPDPGGLKFGDRESTGAGVDRLTLAG